MTRKNYDFTEQELKIIKKALIEVETERVMAVHNLPKAPTVKFMDFLFNTMLLSSKFQICPLLYGSLGLEYLTKESLNSDDIDVLIPRVYLRERWEEFKTYLEKYKYTLVDEHEHTFVYRGIYISYAEIEELEIFAGIKEAEIQEINKDGVQFKLLSLDQYLKVYNQSSKDGYRIDKRHKKDFDKIKFIERKLGLR